MATPLTVRAATTADAEPLAALLLGLESFPALETLSHSDLVRRLEQQLMAAQPSSTQLAGHSFWVAELEGALTGYAAVHWLPCLFRASLDGYLAELFVAASARGQGVGTRLLQAAYREAEQRGCDRLTLVNMRNRQSYLRGFYAKQGWTQHPEAARFTYTVGSTDVGSTDAAAKHSPPKR